MSGAFTIRWVNSCEGINESLWESCFPKPLEGRWWYASLERAGLEDQFEFRYGIIDRDGQSVGIVPVFLMNVPIDLIAPKPIAVALRAVGRLLPRLRYQRTMFVGSACSDEGTIGLCGGVTLRDVAALVQREASLFARFMRAPMLVWKDFLQADTREIAHSIGQAGQFIIPSFPGTRVTLCADQEPTWELYLASLSGSHRHNLRKKLKKAAKASPLTTSVVAELDDRELQEVFALFTQTFEKGDTKFERLPPKFFAEIVRAEPSHFILQRDANGVLVTFMLAFALGNRAINKFIGIDYTRASGDAFLYFQLWKAFVDWATSTGATDLQSGQTGYRAKLDVGHSLVPLFNICRHRNPILNRIFTLATTGVSWSSLDHDLNTYLRAHPEDDQSTPPT